MGEKIMALIAEAAVDFVVKKVGDLLVQEAISLHAVGRDVKWLERELRKMQCFLKVANAKNNGRGIDDELGKIWVEEMEDLASQVEKVIRICRNSNLRGDPFGLIRRCQVRRDVERIRAEMQELLQSKILFGIDTTNPSGSQEILPKLKYDDIDHIVGFDEEKKMIVQDLVGKGNADLSVMSIVDINGRGKTALVGAIYKDSQVRTIFDLVAWITISQEYTIKEILKNILSQVPGTSSIDTFETLAVNLFNELKKYKYLIILVDVWEEDVWDQLQNFFPNVNNGSRVIIITRFSNIVSSSMHFPGERVHPSLNMTPELRTSPRPIRALNACHEPISQTLPATPRLSLSIPITPAILASKHELKKISIATVIPGQTSKKHLQAKLPVVLKVSPFGINTFVISFNREEEARAAERMGPIQLDGPKGPCTVDLAPWSPVFGSMEAATGSHLNITIVNLPLHCRDWETLMEVVKPAGDLVAIQRDDNITLEFVYVLVRPRGVINLPLELELTVGTSQYLIHLKDSQTFEPYNGQRPRRSTHEIPRKEKGKMRACCGEDT